MIRNVLELDRKVFDNKLIDWASEFGFKISGDFLVVNKDTVSDFIDSLEEQFASWERKDEKKK